MAEELDMGTLVGGMMGLVVVAGMAQMIQQPQQPVVPVGKNVGIIPRNAQADWDLWQMGITDHDVTQILSVYGLPMNQAATFLGIPDTWSLPMRVSHIMVYRWVIPGESIENVYYIQGINQYLWDFDTSSWSSEEDPAYRDLNIDTFGNYYYDFSSETFIPL